MSSTLDIFRAANNTCEKFATNLPASQQANPIVKQIVDLKSRISKAAEVVQDLKENDQQSQQLKSEISAAEDELKRLKQQKDALIATDTAVVAEINRLSTLVRGQEAAIQAQINQVTNDNQAQLDAAIELIRQLESQYQQKQNSARQFAQQLAPNIIQSVNQIKQFITPSRPILNGQSDQVTVQEAERAYVAITELLDQRISQSSAESSSSVTEILQQIRNAIVNLQFQIKLLATKSQPLLFPSTVAGVTQAQLIAGPQIEEAVKNKQQLLEYTNQSTDLKSRIKEVDRQFSVVTRLLAQKKQDNELNQTNRSLQQQSLSGLVDNYLQITDVNSANTAVTALNRLLNQKYQSFAEYQAGLPVESLDQPVAQPIPQNIGSLARPVQQVTGMLADVDSYLAGRSGISGAVQLFSDTPLLGPLLDTSVSGFQSALNFAGRIEDQFGSRGKGTDANPMPIDLKFATVDDARRDLMVIEYDLNPVKSDGSLRNLNEIKTTRMKFFINPDKIDINFSKNRTETFTRGGYVYTHWGDKPTTIDMSGNSGTGGVLPVRAMQHFFEVSGKSYEEIGKKYREAASNDGDVFFLDQLRNVTKYINSTAIESGFSKGWYGSYRTRINQDSKITFSSQFNKFDEQKNRDSGSIVSNLLRTADDFGDSVIGTARAGLGLARQVISVASVGIGLSGTAATVPIQAALAPSAIAGKAARQLFRGIPSTSTPTVPVDGTIVPMNVKQGLQAFADANTSDIAKNIFKCDVTAGYQQDLDSLANNKILSQKLKNQQAQEINDQATQIFDGVYGTQELQKEFWQLAQLGFNGSQSQLAQSQLLRENQLYDQWQQLKEQEIIQLTRQADEYILDYRNDFYTLRGIFGNTRLRNVQKYGLKATVRIRLYHEDTLYIGHIDNFSYNRAAERFTVNWNMKFIVEEMFVFPTTIDADKTGTQSNVATQMDILSNIGNAIQGMFTGGSPEIQSQSNSQQSAAQIVNQAEQISNANRFGSRFTVPGQTLDGVTIAIPGDQAFSQSGGQFLGTELGVVPQNGEKNVAKGLRQLNAEGDIGTDIGVSF